MKLYKKELWCVKEKWWEVQAAGGMEEINERMKKAVKMNTEASRFKFIMNSFRAPNFNTVLSLQSLLRHLYEQERRVKNFVCPYSRILPTSEIICDEAVRHVC